MPKEIDKDIRRFKNHIKSMLNSDELLEEQREVLKRYDKMNRAKELAIRTRRNYLCVLKSFSEEIKKPYKEMTKEDLIEFCAYINENWEKNTIRSGKFTIRAFFKWLYDSKDYPDIVSWIKPKAKLNNKKNPDDLIKEDEAFKMLNVTTNPRDKAIIMLLYELGTRGTQVSRVKLKDVSFDGNGGFVFIRGMKKGRDSKIRIIPSVPFLKNWINNHPRKNDREAPLFVSLYSPHERLYRGGMYQMVKRIAKTAGIKKNIYLHLFRHSAMTNLVDQGFVESELEIIGTWVEGSEATRIYVHPTEESVNNKRLRKEGIIKKKDQKTKRILKTKKCINPRCGYENPATNKYCDKCFYPLDSKSAMDLDNKRKELEEKIEKIYPLLKKLEEHPDILEQLRNLK